MLTRWELSHWRDPLPTQLLQRLLVPMKSLTRASSAAKLTSVAHSSE